MIVDDFKDATGRWIRYFSNDVNKRVHTRSGMLWGNMINRCKNYGSVWKQNPCYTGVYHTFTDFQDFAEWCQKQVGYFKDFQLDKDLLSNKETKVYSKETIVFIPQQLNKILVNRKRDRGKFPLGVSWSEERKLFCAYCNNGEGKTVGLGRYDTIGKAFDKYKEFKESLIKQQAEKWKSQIDPRAYEALMNYQVEITD